jgi:hypothetical protein
MPDNLQKRQPEDRTRINISEEWELKYRADKLNVSPERLKAAVEASGPSVTAVKKRLSGQHAR